MYFLSLLFAFALAQTGDCTQLKCEFCTLNKGKIAIQKIPTRTGGCMLTVKNLDNPQRNFTINNFGELQVFHGRIGGKDKGQVTVIPPMGVAPHVRSVSEDKIEIMMANGKLITFNARTALPASIEGCKVSVSPESSLSNPGFEVGPCQVPIARSEFRFDPKSTGQTFQLITATNRSCQIKTKDLFRVTANDSSFLFSNNSSLRQGLKGVVSRTPACQSLGFDFSGLTDPAPVAEVRSAVSNLPAPKPAATSPRPSDDPLGEFLQKIGEGTK